VTGRTHQLRVHAREAFGRGIVGDRVYGVPGGPMLLTRRGWSYRARRSRRSTSRAPLPDYFGDGAMRPEDVVIPEDALSESFPRRDRARRPERQQGRDRSAAPRRPVPARLHPDAYQRLKTIAGSRVTGAGELLITARRYRTQEANRQDARRRLAEMIAAAHIVQAKAQATRRAGPRKPSGLTRRSNAAR
jgi:ribosome-associated protein